MPPLLRLSYSLSSLLLLVLFSAWSCRCQTFDDPLQHSLSLPDPSPSPAPSAETANPLRDPKVRRALIRALARSLQRLGDDGEEELEGLSASDRTLSTEGLVRFHGSLSTVEPREPGEGIGTATIPEHTTEGRTADDFLSDTILNEVDKHIRNGEIHRVSPDEVHVTSKVAPRPFTVDQSSSTYRDSLSSPTDGGEGVNSLGPDETTVEPTVSDLRIEQHEIKAVQNAPDDTAQRSKTADVQSSHSSDNTVDIFRAPLIAAFTVHQDYLTGATRSVVPLFPDSSLSSSVPSPSSPPQGRRENPPLPLPNEELQDLVRQITTHPASTQNGRFPLLTQEQLYRQELLERQRASQQQNLVRFRGLSNGLDSVATHNGNGLSPDQQLVEQSLRRIRQLQELQQLQARLQRLQQQFQIGL